MDHRKLLIFIFCVIFTTEDVVARRFSMSRPRFRPHIPKKAPPPPRREPPPPSIPKPSVYDNSYKPKIQNPTSPPDRRIPIHTGGAPSTARPSHQPSKPLFHRDSSTVKPPNHGSSSNNHGNSVNNQDTPTEDYRTRLNKKYQPQKPTSPPHKDASKLPNHTKGGGSSHSTSTNNKPSSTSNHGASKINQSGGSGLKNQQGSQSNSVDVSKKDASKLPIHTNPNPSTELRVSIKRFINRESVYRRSLSSKHGSSTNSENPSKIRNSSSGVRKLTLNRRYDSLFGSTPKRKNPTDSKKDASSSFIHAEGGGASHSKPTGSSSGTSGAVKPSVAPSAPEEPSSVSTTHTQSSSTNNQPSKINSHQTSSDTHSKPTGSSSGTSGAVKPSVAPSAPEEPSSVSTTHTQSSSTNNQPSKINSHQTSSDTHSKPTGSSSGTSGAVKPSVAPSAPEEPSSVSTMHTQNSGGQPSETDTYPAWANPHLNPSGSSHGATTNPQNHDSQNQANNVHYSQSSGDDNKKIGDRIKEAVIASIKDTGHQIKEAVISSVVDAGVKKVVDLIDPQSTEDTSPGTTIINHYNNYNNHSSVSSNLSNEMTNKTHSTNETVSNVVNTNQTIIDATNAIANSNLKLAPEINITESELITLTEELFASAKLDDNQFLVTNIQDFSNFELDNTANTKNTGSRLFHVEPETYEIPTIKAIRNLYGDFERNGTMKESKTTERREKENFMLDTFLNTKVMEKTMKWLADRNFIDDDVFNRKNTLREIWFTVFDETASGFERIFLSEIENSVIVGVQDWIYFDYLESTKQVDYMGCFAKHDLDEKSALLKISFKMNDIVVQETSLFVGTLPELEMALYTICIYARPNTYCPVSLGGRRFGIYTHSFVDKEGNKLIDLAHVIL